MPISGIAPWMGRAVFFFKQKTAYEIAEDDEDDGTPVDSIKGIGPAYADRLADAEVHTVAELAVSDAETLADKIDVSEKIVGTWIERAQNE